MLDIGPVHRREYELDAGRPSAAERTVKRSAGVSKASVSSGKGSRSRGSSVSNGNKQLIIAQAPGRLNFLGEHSYPGAGIYLSAAIDRWVKVAVSARKDNSLRFYAADLGERKRTTLANLKFKKEDRWANYIKIAIHTFSELGCPLTGLNFTITGNIPQQIGLASSSAIEIASAVALRGFFCVKISDQELIQRLSNAHFLFFGKYPELVDYLVGFSARNDQFLVVDEENSSVTKIKSPFFRCKFIIMDSRVPRFGVGSELAKRRKDIKTGLEILSQGREGASFREFAAMDLLESLGNLPEEIRRRSLHVVQEIHRVFGARDYLVRGELPEFSRLIFNSHESLRDLYELSCPEIDWIVKRAQETVGIFGARMTGQGFGGCTYMIIKNEMLGEYRSKIEDYERIFGFHPAVYEVKLATGCRIVKE